MLIGKRREDMNTRAVGRLGERAAAKFLKKQGCKIIDRNVYVGKAEIDIIALGHSHIIFAEVKTRTQLPDGDNIYGRPADAVDVEKRKHLLDAAAGYLRASGGKYYSLSPRIDIIEVYADPSKKKFKVLDIKHFPDAVHR